MLIRKLKTAIKNKKGFTLIELILAMGITAILLVMMTTVFSFSLTQWSKTRERTNAIELSNDVLEGMRTHIAGSYLGTLSQRTIYSSVTIVDWKNWQTMGNDFDMAVFLIPYDSDGNGGKIAYQRYLNDGATNYSPYYVYPSKHYDNLFIDNLSFVRVLNKTPLYNTNTGAEFYPYDTITVSFDVYSHRVLTDETGAEYHEKMHSVQETIRMENLRSNYAIFTAGHTSTTIQSYLLNVRLDYANNADPDTTIPFTSCLLRIAKPISTIDR